MVIDKLPGLMVPKKLASLHESLYQGTATVDVGEWTWLLRLQASVGNILASIIPRARIVPALRPEDFEPGAEDVCSCAMLQNRCLHAFFFF